jgi:hypothetical protein
VKKMHKLVPSEDGATASTVCGIKGAYRVVPHKIDRFQLRTEKNTRHDMTLANYEVSCKTCMRILIGAPPITRKRRLYASKHIRRASSRLGLLKG